MKKILKLMILSSLLLTVLGACNKDENKDYFLGGTPPVMTAVSNTSADSIQMKAADSTKTALSLSWTNPNYKFTTGTNSQDVTYQLQIDTTGANFTNPLMKVISVSKDLGLAITESQLNDYMLNQLGLAVNVIHHLDMRVISSLGTNAVPLISNTVKFSATPYAIPPKVPPPVTGNLYLVGDATLGGWNNPVPVPAQQFTRVSPTLYQITVQMIGGKQYLFLPLNGSWSNKYACKNLANQSAAGGDFGYNFNDNFPGPASDGTYKIVVDFQKGKYTVTKQ